MRTPLRVILLAGCAALIQVPADSQETRTGGQEGLQQQESQSPAPAQRGDATRVFLGLGAVPDKAAAARGAPVFARDCGFCHGPTGRGATGPSLITSDRVLADDHGERLLPFLRKGTPEKGMPAFATMGDRQLTDIAEFLHLQVENVANRGTYRVLNIVVGNAARGRAYVEGHCMRCHTAGTFSHFASRFRSPEQLQRNWIWPAHAASMTAHVKTPKGAVAGRVVQISDFRITLVDPSGKTLAIDRDPDVEIEIDEPLAAHREIVNTLANDEMHDVTAYLETLK